VKRPSEAYSTEKRVALSKSGQPWRSPYFNGGRPLEMPSEFEHAVLGALCRFRASGQLRHSDIVLSDHEKSLISEAVNQLPWSGEIEGVHYSDYRDAEHVKAILDSTTSGGSYLNPTFFDEMVVTYPLLYGEITPHVQTASLPRGSSVESGAISTPTVTWNDAEGTTVDLYDTTSLISQISASVFPVMVAVEMGRDVLADTPVNLGQIIAGLIGERFQAELDNQIANGDGTTEPEGIFTASGTSSISSENGTAGAATVGDVERLVFGIGKQYRRDNFKPRFGSSDTMYRRLCSVPVGASDARRVLQPDMAHENYTLMGRPFSIQNDVANGSVAFAALFKAYRLWQRQGTEMRFSDEGNTLMRRNTVLLVAPARFAGKVVDPNAVCKCTDLDQTDG